MFTRVLVPLDRSPLAEQALGTAIAIASAAKAEIRLVLASEPLIGSGFATEMSWDERRIEDGMYLRSIAEEIQSEWRVPVSHAVAVGFPVEAICERVLDTGADLIVMTSHGRTGFSRAWMGSVADGVVRRSSVPVLMLRPNERLNWRAGMRAPIQRILGPMDGSPESTAILDPAASLATCGGASVILARVVVPVPASVVDAAMTGAYPLAVFDGAETEARADAALRDLDEISAALTSVPHVATDVAVANGVAPAIIELAERHGADVIAMTTHGRGASRLLIGSVADKVLRGSSLPILLYRPVGAASEAGRLRVSEITPEGLLSPA